eukprot:1815391-Pleurochrysis_carterae.AAC.1
MGRPSHAHPRARTHALFPRPPFSRPPRTHAAMLKSTHAAVLKSTQVAVLKSAKPTIHKPNNPRTQQSTNPTIRTSTYQSTGTSARRPLGLSSLPPLSPSLSGARDDAAHPALSRDASKGPRPRRAAAHHLARLPRALERAARIQPGRQDQGGAGALCLRPGERRTAKRKTRMKGL